tara:strand:- start:53 stop:247 length:195 start_codon:yes stop_codon:yes gene_type:complete
MLVVVAVGETLQELVPGALVVAVMAEQEQQEVMELQTLEAVEAVQVILEVIQELLVMAELVVQE